MKNGYYELSSNHAAIFSLKMLTESLRMSIQELLHLQFKYAKVWWVSNVATLKILKVIMRKVYSMYQVFHKL